jgi:hypothetical protein
MNERQLDPKLWVYCAEKNAVSIPGVWIKVDNFLLSILRSYMYM